MADKVVFAEPIDAEMVRRIFEGSHDPVARLNGLALLAALAEAQRERDEARHDARAQLAAVEAERDRFVRAGQDAIKDLDAAQRREELARPVLEEARAFRHQEPGRMTGSHALFAAVDTYETQTGGTE